MLKAKRNTYILLEFKLFHSSIPEFTGACQQWYFNRKSGNSPQEHRDVIDSVRTVKRPGMAATRRNTSADSWGASLDADLSHNLLKVCCVMYTKGCKCGEVFVQHQCFPREQGGEQGQTTFVFYFYNFIWKFFLLSQIWFWVHSMGKGRVKVRGSNWPPRAAVL